MARTPRRVEDTLARFDEISARLDGHAPSTRAAARRHYGRSARSLGKRVGAMTAAIGALIVATIGFGWIVGPIGIGGLFLVALAIIFILIFMSVWPGEKAEKPYTQDMSNRQVVSRLDSILHLKRPALPSPAGRRVDAISAQLPLLESRLGELDALDPLAQDARRLMGQHLPELIERYERVPPAYRQQRDGEGLTVDERLVAGLDAAKTALDDLGARLTRGDLDAFETQGRFIESRYKDDGGVGGQ
ncbi:hypothetical protein IC614_05325 [Allosphingosinicella flava]|uniref:Uncharacterized protein n=1 Tax=Allosphingosinicella flava TaxID=2771430 RepID=A0A7T2GLE1_9SPHN|nr:hypothetical protein [Sphingosinicella flava]QPQ56001.1 hypothetical protein IC614_05325 [Sphingosinicella flava]